MTTSPAAASFASVKTMGSFTIAGELGFPTSSPERERQHAEASPLTITASISGNPVSLPKSRDFQINLPNFPKGGALNLVSELGLEIFDRLHPDRFFRSPLLALVIFRSTHFA